MISVLFEDNDIIAIDKPEGTASIPERERSAESVSGMISSQFGQRLYIVHRLDKDVSGVLLFARSTEAHRHLNLQFMDRKVRKTYTGLVWGEPPVQSGSITFPIRSFGSGRMGVDEIRGKTSLTEYDTLHHFRDFTLLDLHPLTGRRHQLRVHLYAFGHPLAGDRRYGERRKQDSFPRLMLHAASITFQLPDGNGITIHSEPPDSFNQVIRRLEA